MSPRWFIHTIYIREGRVFVLAGLAGCTSDLINLKVKCVFDRIRKGSSAFKSEQTWWLLNAEMGLAECYFNMPRIISHLNVCLFCDHVCKMVKRLSRNLNQWLILIVLVKHTMLSNKQNLKKSITNYIVQKTVIILYGETYFSRIAFDILFIVASCHHHH